MSIQFNPKKLSTASNQLPPQPKLTLLQKWINAVHDGYLKESLHPQKYCKKAWIQQTGTPFSQATKVFMRSCMSDCSDYKAYCRWSRLN